MSKKLKQLIKLLNTDFKTRDETEMGTFVTWLRRRVPLLKYVETGK